VIDVFAIKRDRYISATCLLGMAINLPVGTARYSFQNPQQYAMQLRLTPEVRDALLKAQQTGDSTSLRLTGTGSDNVRVTFESCN